MHNGLTVKNTSVTLGDHFDQFISGLLARGRYQSASEVLREGLRLLEEREARLEALRAALAHGESSGFESFSFEEINRLLDKESAG